MEARLIRRGVVVFAGTCSIRRMHRGAAQSAPGRCIAPPADNLRAFRTGRPVERPGSDWLSVLRYLIPAPNISELILHLLCEQVQVCRKSAQNILRVVPSRPATTRSVCVAILRIIAQLPVEEIQFATTCVVTNGVDTSRVVGPHARGLNSGVDSAGIESAKSLVFNAAIYQPPHSCESCTNIDGRPQVSGTGGLPGEVGELLGGDVGLAQEGAP